MTILVEYWRITNRIFDKASQYDKTLQEPTKYERVD
jgi:hypothetical protein